MQKNRTTHSTTAKLAVAGLLTAAAVAGSLLSVPVAGSKCAPVQHMVNVFAAVILGPWWGVGIAFCASFLRNLMGIGSLLAFPVAKLLMGLEPGGFTVYMIPFFISTLAGSILAYIVLRVLEKSHVLEQMREN